MNPELPTPTRPRALTSTVSEDGDAIAVSMREGSLGTAAFLSLWLAGWTVACGLLVQVCLTQRELVLVLFGIPFWVSWLFVAGWLVNLVFTRVTFVLDATGLAYERWLPGMVTRRFVPLAELRGIQSRVFHVDSENGVTHGIEIQTLGRSLAIGTGLPPLERDWLADRLDRHRVDLQAEAGLELPADIDQPDCRTFALPTDSTWSLEDDFEGPHFVQRARFDLATVLGMLFATLFWNGGVGFFVVSLAGLDRAEAAPRDAAWWALFVFLIPFEVIGVGLAIGLIAAILDPVRVTRWRFGRDAVSRVTTRAGLPVGWNRRYPHDGLAAAAVRDDVKPRGPFGMGIGSHVVPTGSDYGLLVADGANVEVCTIPGLTLGEARWMKGILQAAGCVR